MNYKYLNLKYKYRFLLLLFCVSFSGQAAAGKKYSTALVFSGGGPNIPIFLGILEGLESQEIRPDVIIGTCGGSIATALVRAIPDPEQRREYVKSEAFRDCLRSPEFPERKATRSVLNLLKRINGHYWFNSGTIPDIFTGVLTKTSDSCGLKELQIGFEEPVASDKQPASVILAARTLIGKPGSLPGDRFNKRKLAHEVFFTDRKTGAMLEGFESQIGRDYPKSAVDIFTEVIYDKTLDQASRASISDPYYINPIQMDEFYFLTGAIDLYPIEVARHLAEKVILSYDSTFNTYVSLPVHYNVYKYNINKRNQSVRDSYANYWIDRTDFGKIIDEIGLSPELTFRKARSGVPENLDAYRERVDLLWQWGKERAIEAVFDSSTGMPRPLNDKSHIRHKSREK